jgi:hypothetical protein
VMRQFFKRGDPTGPMIMGYVTAEPARLRP